MNSDWLCYDTMTTANVSVSIGAANSHVALR